MKFTTYLRGDQPRIALVDGDHLVDLNDAQPNVPAVRCSDSRRRRRWR